MVMGGRIENAIWLRTMTVDSRGNAAIPRADVEQGDMYAIYAHLDTMKRIWRGAEQPEPVLRRLREQVLVRPYAKA